MAFDCLPHAASLEAEHKDGAAETEGRLVNSLRRLLDSDFKVAVTGVQVPIFAGEGSSLCIETLEPVAPERAAEWLGAQPGIALIGGVFEASTRTSVGSDDVRVARVRRDFSAADPECSLMLLSLIHI